MPAHASLSQHLPAVRRGFIAAGFLLALSIAGWRAPPALPSLPTLNNSPDRPAPAPTKALPSLQQAVMLPGMGEVAANPSLTRLTDGRLACAWLTHPTGHPEQATLWLSIMEHTGWREAQPLANLEYTAGEIFAHIRQIEAPVIHQHGSHLHLWYAANTLWGDGAQFLMHSRSADLGEHWTPPARVSISPLGSRKLQLGAPPRALADGSLALAIRPGQGAEPAEWLRLTTEGRVIDRWRDAPSLAGLPAAPVSPQRASAVHRLADGRWLLAGNPPGQPGTLSLWLSHDETGTWQLARTLESADDGLADFANPALLQGPEGWIDLVYSWRGQGIRHMRFSPAWLAGDAP